MEIKRNPMIPIALIFVLMAVQRLLGGGFSNLGDWLMTELLMLPGIVIAISFHEFGHAFVSTKLGDPTPEKQGRVTLNPLAHIDPVGMACLIFAGFGWGIPVEIDPRFYSNRRRDEILVGLAGVTMNLILAIVFSIIVRLTVPLTGMMGADISFIVTSILQNTVFINVVLMIFNLLPVPPLDGFGIATQIFRLERYSWYPVVYSYGYFILIFMVLIGIVDTVLGPLVGLAMRPLQFIMFG